MTCSIFQRVLFSETFYLQFYILDKYPTSKAKEQTTLNDAVAKLANKERDHVGLMGLVRNHVTTIM